MKKRIFISLNHADKGIAEAIKEALHTLLRDQVDVAFSVSSELNSGIKPGEDWIDWIGKHVRISDLVVALMTPNSVDKPWILWELGAVYGASASNSEAERKIRPLLYRITGENMPSPIHDLNIQYKSGDNRLDAVAFFIDIVETFQRDIPSELYRNAIALLESERRKTSDVLTQEAEKSLSELRGSQAVISVYLRTVEGALDSNLPEVPAHEWREGLFHNARHAITGFLVKDTKEGDVAQATIQRASVHAEDFYGYPPNSGKLVGKKITELIEMLEGWMSPDDFKDFLADQKTNAEAFAKGMLSSARVPIVFDDRHPNSAFHGKSFLPFTLHLSKGLGASFMTILYLDLKQLPARLKKRFRSQDGSAAYGTRPAPATETAVM